jgi:pyrroline-5-carboxylate reductase
MTSVLKLPAPTWFVGCGNMGGAMLEGWRGADVDVTGAVAIRPSGRDVEGVRTVKSPVDAGPPPVAILGFKPDLDEVAPVLRGGCRRIRSSSRFAGVEAATLRSRFPGAG